MLGVWLFICRFFAYLFLAGHGYRVKSQVYRWLFERQYLKYSISTFPSLAELAAFTKTLVWTADTWKQLWDAISYPNTVECIGRYGDKRVGDCDEFAIYIANVVYKSIEVKLLKDVSNPRLLTIMWLTGWTTGGHNVCLLEFPNEVAERRFGYMDYGMPIHGPTVEAVVEKVLMRYTRAKGVCIGWSISDPLSLKPLKTSWGL